MAGKVITYVTSTVLVLLTVSAQSTREKYKSQWEEKLHLYKTGKKDFSFASYYGSHMVLQRAPKRATIWGYSPNIGDVITVKLNDSTPYSTKVYLDPIFNCGLWKFLLPAESNPGPFTITATSGHKTIHISDVMFGDVWLCSGQSNMVFTVHQGFNFSEEIADAKNYPDVRVFTVGHNVSSTPLLDLKGIMEPWSRGSAAAVHGEPKPYFSAVCWFYGKALHKKFGYPIGLITSAWSGTQIESWSSPDALSKCGLDKQAHRTTYLPHHRQERKMDEPFVRFAPTTSSSLWNSMVLPLINMTIYGVIWYQGESNTVVNANKYNCTFPAMIDDWRHKFHHGSNGWTDAMFPFGFVQLGPNSSVSDIQGYPEVRWHQTADYGYVPNPRMQKVFMAVVIDLTDFASPYGCVHIRDKQDVAARLILGALSVAYKRPGLLYQGPLPSHIVEGTNNISLVCTANLQYNNMAGFEAMCPVKNSNLTFWTEIPILPPLLRDRVVLWSGVCGQGQTILGVRYLWQESPCAFKTCTVYSAENPLLPGPPFIVYKQMTGVEGTVHTIDWNTPVHGV